MAKLMPRFALPLIAAALAVWALSSIDSDDRNASAASAVPAKPPVVLIIMDEFPVDQMLGSDGKIDPIRYPNFAALARTSTWFKNASTTYDSTTHATPEIMDAKLPSRSVGPTYKDHPRSVYTLFGRRGYRIVDSEEATSVCPPRYCGGAKPHRPAILPFLQSGRRERLERFFAQIKPGPPTLYVKHVLLPHGPYLFLPSGKQTRRTFRDPLPGMNGPVGFGDRGLTEHNQQRLQLQIGFADHELGKLFARMRASGSFNQALIAITADHGISSEVGVKDRRTVTPSNIDEVAPVPMFVKRPGQVRGGTSSAYVRTIDLVPTIADILNVRMYRADGRSAFSRTVRRRRFVRIIRRDFSGTITVSARNMEKRRRAVVRRKLALFGQGDLASLYTGIGPNRKLLGRATAQLRPAGLGKLRSQIANAGDMRNVNPASIIHATDVAGSITGGGSRGGKRDLAVAVNGRIEAVGRSFRLRGSSKESYALMVPELALRPGRNTVELFEVTGKGTKLQLIARA